jgi:hypothetical protein
LIWTGSAASLHPLWVLDAAFSDHFPIGASGSFPQGTSGGAVLHTHDDSHTHTVSVSSSGGATLSGSMSGSNSMSGSSSGSGSTGSESNDVGNLKTITPQEAAAAAAPHTHGFSYSGAASVSGTVNVSGNVAGTVSIPGSGTAGGQSPTSTGNNTQMPPWYAVYFVLPS